MPCTTPKYEAASLHLTIYFPSSFYLVSKRTENNYLSFARSSQLLFPYSLHILPEFPSTSISEMLAQGGNINCTKSPSTELETGETTQYKGRGSDSNRLNTAGRQQSTTTVDLANTRDQSCTLKDLRCLY